jgi:hypothetical protein
MFNRKPYRKGKTYFFHITFKTPDGFKGLSINGTLTALMNRSEEEMHRDILSIVIQDARRRGNNITCPINELAVIFYRIQEN